jgi:integration host factor subunit alpha
MVMESSFPNIMKVDITYQYMFQYVNKKEPPKLTALTKTTIIEKISTKNNQTPSQAKNTVETLLEIMKSTLASGKNVMISGFGKFQVNEKAPRKGRNPSTGKEMMLDGRRTVTFKCSGGLRDRVNGN